jgi:hypothetical protein
MEPMDCRFANTAANVDVVALLGPAIEIEIQPAYAHFHVHAA